MTILERMASEEKGKTLIEPGSLQDIPLEAIVEAVGKLKESLHLPKPVEFSRGGAKDSNIIGERMQTKESICKHYKMKIQNYIKQ